MLQSKLTNFKILYLLLCQNIFLNLVFEKPQRGVHTCTEVGWLTYGLTSQSITMIMPRRSGNLTTLYLSG